MNRAIQVALEEDRQTGGPTPVLPSTSMHWLDNTMAPDDWNMFRALSGINPNFSRFYEDFLRGRGNANSPDNLYSAYKLLVGIRQGVMRYIAAPKGNGKGRSENESQRTGLRLAPEIDIILKYVLDEVDDERIAAVITDVQRISYEVGRGHDTHGVKLSSGILTQDERPSNIHVKNLGELAVEGNVIASKMNGALQVYLEKRIWQEVTKQDEAEYAISKIELAVLGFQTENGKTDIAKPTKSFIRKKLQEIKVDKERTQFLDQIADKMANEVIYGPSLVSNPEKVYLFSEMIRDKKDKFSKLPEEFNEYGELEDRLEGSELSVEKQREIRRRQKELRKILIADHGFDPSIKLRKFPRFEIRAEVQHHLAEQMPLSAISEAKLEEETDIYARRNGLKFFTPEEEAEIVKQYGLNDLNDLSWI
jgi:hypothetical protein